MARNDAAEIEPRRDADRERHEAVHIQKTTGPIETVEARNQTVHRPASREDEEE